MTVKYVGRWDSVVIDADNIRRAVEAAKWCLDVLGRNAAEAAENPSCYGTALVELGGVFETCFQPLLQAHLAAVRRQKSR